jgi:hypothetical protein
LLAGTHAGEREDDSEVEKDDDGVADEINVITEHQQVGTSEVSRPKGKKNNVSQRGSDIAAAMHAAV